MDTLHKELRNTKDGMPVPSDTRGVLFRNIRGWNYGGKNISDRNLLSLLIHRIAKLEDAVNGLGLRECYRCKGWMGPKADFFFHNSKPICDTCMDYVVIDEPEGFKIPHLVRYILQNGIKRDKWEHWAEYLSDDDNPKETDLEFQLKLKAP